MILPDGKVVEELREGGLVIDPLDVGDINSPAEEVVSNSEMIQPSSVDLSLSNEFITFSSQPNQTYIDPRSETKNYSKEFHTEDDGYIIQPGEFVLGKTDERVEIHSPIRGVVHGRSSWARIAVQPHVEGGYIDPGWEGNITLEILNSGPMPVLLPPGARFCQIEFARLESPPIQSYDGKYQGDEETTASRLHEDFQG